MVILWAALALIGAIVVQNLGWLLLPLLLAVIARNVSPEDYIHGRSLPHSAGNFIVGNAVGFWSMYVATWITRTNTSDSSWPIYAIFLYLLIGGLQSLRLRITPYSWLAAVGQIVGIILGLAGSVFDLIHFYPSGT
jgi:hypothetical protein